MREAFGTGKTIDEAIDRACESLGVERELVEFEIIDLPKKGLFGMKTPAKARVYIEAEEAPEVEAVEAPAKKAEENKPKAKKQKKAEAKAGTAEKAPEERKVVSEISDKAKAKIEKAEAYIRSITDAMGLDSVEITSTLYEDGLLIKVDGQGVGVIIGKRGDALDALQMLVSLSVNKSDDEYMRISIDSGDYREKRKKTLESLAVKVAKNVAATGRKHTFEPMSSYERRIIHAAVSEINGVSSKSFGEEPERKVVILSDNPRNSRGSKGGQRRNSSHSRPRVEAEANAPKTENHTDDSEYFGSLYSKIEL